MDVILIMAMTADGRIAKNSDHVADWTGSDDKKYFIELTKDAGVMIMGSKTFDTLDKPLPNRLNIVMTKDESRVSNDSNLIFTDKSPEEIIKDLSDTGYDKVALIGGPTINSLFIKSNLITKIHVTVVPRLFGGGLSIFDQSCDLDIVMTSVSVKCFDNGSILLMYDV